MWRPVQRVFAELDAWRYQRRIQWALALHRRGEARRDGLELASICSNIEIEWSARDIHPWDCHRSPEEKRVAFVAQTLSDTEAAIGRLFEALPAIGALQIRVLGIRSSEPILGGTVYRASLSGIRPELSIGMRLRELGITYHSAGLRFESLADQGFVYDRPWTERFPEMATFYKSRKP
jgi:hypothetical protein